jgi:hypothetical protein
MRDSRSEKLGIAIELINPRPWSLIEPSYTFVYVEIAILIKVRLERCKLVPSFQRWITSVTCNK